MKGKHAQQEAINGLSHTCYKKGDSTTPNDGLERESRRRRANGRASPPHFARRCANWPVAAGIGPLLRRTRLGTSFTLPESRGSGILSQRPRRQSVKSRCGQRLWISSNRDALRSPPHLNGSRNERERLNPPGRCRFPSISRPHPSLISGGTGRGRHEAGLRRTTTCCWRWPSPTRSRTRCYTGMTR